MSYSKPTAKLDFRSWNSALRPACTAGWLVCSDSPMHILADEGLTCLTRRNPAAFGLISPSTGLRIGPWNRLITPYILSTATRSKKR